MLCALTMGVVNLPCHRIINLCCTAIGRDRDEVTDLGGREGPIGREHELSLGGTIRCIAITADQGLGESPIAMAVMFRKGDREAHPVLVSVPSPPTRTANFGPAYKFAS